MAQPTAGRFDRQQGIDGWDQRRLAAARVIVLGVGALGNEMSRLLAMAGVGELVLCDPDVVALTNLSRTVLFRERDLDRPKATVAAQALADLAPGTRVEARVGPLVEAVGLAELRDATLVVSCLDSRAARVQLAGRCGLAGVGMLDAGTSAWGGEVRWFPAWGRCYGCGLGREGRAVEDDPYSCAAPILAGPVAASAPISAVIGAWQAASAARLICGLPLPGPTVSLSFAGPLTVVEQGPVDEDCPLHDRLADALVTAVDLTNEAPVADLLRLLGPAENLFTWTDFRTATDSVSRIAREAPPTASLRELGVAPREILPIRPPGTAAPLRYFELAA
jgi:molybdopterin/thiamine biosynthesis adenylyltransferase